MHIDLHVGLLESFSTVARGRLARSRQSLLQAPFDAQTAHQVGQAGTIVQNVAKLMIHAAETMQAHDRRDQQAEAVRHCAEHMHMSTLFMLNVTQEVPVTASLTHDLQQMLSHQQHAQAIMLLSHQLKQDAEVTLACVQQYCRQLSAS